MSEQPLELKPCPFCGALPVISRWPATGRYDVRCINDFCDVRPVLIQTLEDQIDAVLNWNYRYNEPEGDDE